MKGGTQDKKNICEFVLSENVLSHRKFRSNVCDFCPSATMSEPDVWDFSANQFIYLKTTKYITPKTKCNIFALILLWIFTNEIPVTVAQVLTFKSYPAALQWWHTDVFTAQTRSYLDTLIQAALLGRPVALILNKRNNQPITWSQLIKDVVQLAEVQIQHQNGEERGFKLSELLVADGLIWVFQRLLI